MLPKYPGQGPRDLSKPLEQLKILLKEKIELGEVVRFEAAAGSVLGHYEHVQGGRGVNGVLVELAGGSDELAHDIAVHIAFARPRYLRREDVPAEILEKEKEIARERARNEGKPEKVLERIVEGRISKFYEEVVLLDQPFVKEATVTIDQLVKSKIAKLGENMGIARFVRFKVGDVAAAESGSENAQLESVTQ